MELFRASENLLLPFLAPSAARLSPTKRPALLGQYYRPTRLQCYQAASRPLSTSPALKQQTPALRPELETEQSSRPPSATDEISTLQDSTFELTEGTSTASAQRTSRSESNARQSAHKPSEGSSMDELLDMMKIFPTRQSGTTRGSNEISRMINPRGSFSSPPPPPLEKPPMKLGPTVGRTIVVDSGRNMDVARAFRTLEVQCARNSVRKDFMRQRFHERGGLKRKRLKSERWRRRFKEAFVGTVAMVQKMRRQGW